MANTINKKKVKTVRIGVVVSRFNEFISQQLLDGCLAELLRNGIKKKDIKVVWVPGAFEIPVTALKLAKTRSVDSVICLGSVIRGETSHFELVSQGAMQGIMQVGLMTGKPVIFEVLSTDTVELALKRADVAGMNKGSVAASAALEMVKVLSEF